MKVIDLTHEINEDMLVFPGTKPPVIVDCCTIEKDGFAEKTITMFTHTGTHMDAPAHVLPNKKTLDKFPASHFVGKAFLLDCSNKKEKITLSDVQKLTPFINQIDYLIIYTGWSKYWGSENYFKNFPVLNEKAANFLANSGLKGIGLDTISVDPVDENTLPIHKILFEKELIIVENLNLSQKLPQTFTFSSLPLKINDADGSPLRAVAIIA